MPKEEVRKALVYVYYNTERDEQGAKLMEHPTDELLELTKDRRLIEASCAMEENPAQGIVCAYFGVDGHWHFDHYQLGAAG